MFEKLFNKQKKEKNNRIPFWMNGEDIKNWDINSINSIDSIDSETNFRVLTEFNLQQLKGINEDDFLKKYKWWVFSAINTIWRTTSMQEYWLFNKNWDKVIHPYIELINRQLIFDIVAFLELTWDAYIWKRTYGGNKVLSLEVLNNSSLFPIMNPNGIQIDYYEYMYWNTKIRLETNEVIDIHNFNPFQNHPRLNWVWTIEAIFLQLENDEWAIKYAHKGYTQGSNWNPILETDNEIPEAEKESFLEKFKRKYLWINNARTPIMLSHWFKWKDSWKNLSENQYVQWREFTRDEIFSIFWVPKSISGMAESVNVGNVEAFDKIFLEHKILPICLKISEILNKELFNWIWEFKFINVLQRTSTEIKQDFDSGAMTANEYRKIIWLEELEEDFIKISEFSIMKLNKTKEKEKKEEKEEKKENKLDINYKNFEKIFNNKIKENWPWSDKYENKRWENKIKIADKFQKELLNVVKKIYKDQVDEYLEEFNNINLSNWNNWINFKKYNNKINNERYKQLFITLSFPILEKLILEQWEAALLDVGSNDYSWSNNIIWYLNKRLETVWDSITTTSRNMIEKAIEKGREKGLWIEELGKAINEEFKNLKTHAEVVVRTETMNASTQAQIDAWKQSWVVESVVWWTSLDERTCDECWAMHWKEIELGMPFYRKWDKVDWSNRKNDFEDVFWSPLHPNCRCNLRPKTRQ